MELESLFRDVFLDRYATLLEGGAEEPVYRASTEVGAPHRIHYTRDYFRSALHEVAHWCVAGPWRRERDDYGYWYAPDGRNAAQQAEFMRVEVRPQAYEALFCAACNHPFRVSLDNLAGEAGDEAAFSVAVYRQAVNFNEQGLAERPAWWVAALWRAFRGPLQDCDTASLAQALDATFQRA